MKKAHFILTALMLLSACAQPAPLTTASPAPTPTRVTATATGIPTKRYPTPRPTFVPRPTQTPWIKTYPTKKAILIYGVGARAQYSLSFMERGHFEFNPILTLYEDGQIIFGPGWREKQLSPEKAAEIMANLEQLGLYKIQDTYAADPQNPIYAVPTEISSYFDSSSALFYLIVNDQQTKEIRYTMQWEDYLTEPMKEIVAYLKNIPEDGSKRFQPDRLLVGIIDEDQVPLEGESFIRWPEDVTPPTQRTRYDGVLYLEGVEAQKIYNLWMDSENGVFRYDGKKFLAIVRPILPNECQTYHYWENPPDDQSQNFFSCDDW